MRIEIIVDVSEAVCANCRNFIQHYYRYNNSGAIAYNFSAVNSGHCVGSTKTRQREPLNKACDKFESSYEEKEP